jgi:hypothetical protein
MAKAIEPRHSIVHYVFDSTADCFSGGDFKTWAEHNIIHRNGSRGLFEKSALDTALKDEVECIVCCNDRKLVTGNRILFVVTRPIEGEVTDGYIYDSRGNLLEHRTY